MKNFKAVNQVFFITLIAVSLFIGMSAVSRAEAATKVHQVSTVDQLEDAIDDAETNGRPDDIVVKGDQTYALSSALVIDIQDGKKVVIRKKPKSTTKPVLDGGGSDRVFLIKQGEVELRKLTITHGHVGPASDGGGIFISSSDVNLKLVDCLIDNNLAPTFGGGIFNQGGTIEIVGSIIKNNSAGSGGGIYNASYFTTGGTIIIRAGTVIEENEASCDGGGIYNYEGDLEISSSIVRDNKSESCNGGGIFNNTDGVLTIRLASRIESNEAGNNGGGIENRGKMTIRGDSRVINNEAPFANGGGISNHGSTADLMLLDSVVSDNIAYGSGGIRNYDEAQLTIKGGLIRNNRASAGGGITNASGATATITHGTRIIYNTAFNPAVGGDGGGVLNAAASLTIENDCFVRYNTAANRGGGIFNSSDIGSVVTLKDMAITFNTANIFAGGGIYNDNPGGLTCINIINNATNNPDACAPAANCPAACTP